MDILVKSKTVIFPIWCVKPKETDFYLFIFSILLSDWVRWWKGNRCASDSELCLCGSARGFTVTPYQLLPTSTLPQRVLDAHLSLGHSAHCVCQSASLWTSVYFLHHQSSWLQPNPTTGPCSSIPNSPAPPPASSTPARYSHKAVSHMRFPPPRHQLWSNYARPVVHLMLSCHITLVPWPPPLSNSLRNCPSASLTKKNKQTKNNSSFKFARFDCAMCPKCGHALSVVKWETEIRK